MNDDVDVTRKRFWFIFDYFFYIFIFCKYWMIDYSYLLFKEIKVYKKIEA